MHGRRGQLSAPRTPGWSAAAAPVGRVHDVGPARGDGSHTDAHGYCSCARGDVPAIDAIVTVAQGRPRISGNAPPATGYMYVAPLSALRRRGWVPTPSSTVRRPARRLRASSDGRLRRGGLRRRSRRFSGAAVRVRRPHRWARAVAAGTRTVHVRREQEGAQVLGRPGAKDGTADALRQVRARW